MPRCLVHTCMSKSSEIVTFHMLPKDEELRKHWLLAIMRDPTDNYSWRNQICSKHFRTQDLVTQKGKRCVLRGGAIPTQNLPTFVAIKGKHHFSALETVDKSEDHQDEYLLESGPILHCRKILTKRKNSKNIILGKAAIESCDSPSNLNDADAFMERRDSSDILCNISVKENIAVSESGSEQLSSGKCFGPVKSENETKIENDVSIDWDQSAIKHEDFHIKSEDGEDSGSGQPCPSNLLGSFKSENEIKCENDEISCDWYLSAIKQEENHIKSEDDKNNSSEHFSSGNFMAPLKSEKEIKCEEDNTSGECDQSDNQEEILIKITKSGGENDNRLYPIGKPAI